MTSENEIDELARKYASMEEYPNTVWLRQGFKAGFTAGARSEKVKHNHITRDIKPLGQCPGCDEYHDRHIPKAIKGDKK